MTGGRQQDSYVGQIAEIVRGLMQLMQLETRSKGFFPQELADLKDRLDKMPPKSEAHRSAKYDLFYLVSSILYQKSSLTMGELSSALSVPLSTATRMMDWMVDNGHATRLPEPGDRRIVRVALTENGRRLHEIADRYVAQRVQQILSGLTVQEQATLVALLGKVVACALKGIRR